jgi:hypothetical protein
MFRLSLTLLEILSVAPTPDASLRSQDILMPAIIFDEGSPKVEISAKRSWSVIGSFNYHFDTECEYKELRVELHYMKDRKLTRSGPVFRDLNGGGTKRGSYTAEFRNIAEPVDGEILTVNVILVATHPEQGEREWRASRSVPKPAK